ncbi:MAG: gliding motility-associated C-terminal domain-containing protein [Flavobacteriales bacterium]
MKKLILLSGIFAFLGFQSASSQIVGVGHSSQASTTYTSTATNDTIYFWCGAGTLGTLTATPPSGVPGWNFIWQVFNPVTNSWDPFTVQNGVPTSTINNLAGGLYRVSIVDGTSTVVGCYRAWVSIVTNPTTVDVAPIPPGCGSVQLNGTINYGSATQLYNPPADPFLVGPTTTITVCFTANHTYVSDLAFYLVGPTTCGSPSILLSPNPGAIGQGAVCNGGNNVSNLCFTTNPAGNLNVCTATVPLTGTYSSYGPSNTPINWTGIYGCDATLGGWRVQIYDCIGADVGALTNSTITFSGQTTCGQNSTITYNSGTINSPILDNSCSAATASIFTVPVTAATPIPYVGGYIWTANPAITIPNATTSLNPLVNPGPTQNTIFTLTLTGGSVPTCTGGNNSDSELYIYTPPTFPTITPVAPVCVNSGPFALSANIPGGTWSGPGIIDPVNGIFDPSIAGVGTPTVTYSFSGPCGGGDSETITVTGISNSTITPVGPFCTTDPIINLTAASPGGTWSGTGITNPSTGEFNPALVSGTTTITYTISGACGSSDTETITVNTANPIIDPVSPLCVNGSPITLTANSTGTWSGNGITSASGGTFDPAVAGVGTHVITFTVSAPCPGSTTTSITVNALPAANAGNNASFCAGGTGVQLNATGGVTYAWSPATGLSNPAISNPTATPASTTVYTVTVTGNNGCSSTSSVTVTVNPLPTVSLPANATFCAGGSTVLNVTGTATSFAWTPSNGLSSTTTSNPTASPSANTTYTVTGTDANGCTATASVNVVVSSITATATATPPAGVEPLDVVFTNTTVGGVMYAWNYGNGQSEITANTTTSATYPVDSTFYVTLIATNADGCVDTLVLTIVVYDDFSLLIPNVFSPNGDGSNDEFRIVATGVVNMTMTIYNRWGKEVGMFNSPSGSWDGKNNGKMSPEGTYFYIFKAEKSDGTPIEQNGTVTLVIKK